MIIRSSCLPSIQLSFYRNISVKTATSMAARVRQRFAPLDESKSRDPTAQKLQGIVFDVDGTLW
jgi:hypothetical protein